MGESRDQGLYRVVVSGRNADIQKVAEADPDFETADRTAVVRINDSMRMMQEQEADGTKLDSTRYFRGLRAAKEFARMCFKDIQQEVEANRDAMERLTFG